MKWCLGIWLLAVCLGAEPVSANDNRNQGTASAVRRSYEASGWFIQETDHFRVCTRDRRLALDDVPELCEELRAEIVAAWLEPDAVPGWTPRCDVIVHASLAEYQRVLGTSVGRSVGCATMKVDGGRVVSRRIDIRADADTWRRDALPHELTHVVLADRFAGRRLPPWADEGIGVLSESVRKQEIRAAAFAESVGRGIVYRPAELIALRQFPRAGYHEAFYAQSATLVRTLVERDSPARFLEFVDRAIEDGEVAALEAVYGIRGVGELKGITQPAQVSDALSDRSAIGPDAS